MNGDWRFGALHGVSCFRAVPVRRVRGAVYVKAGVAAGRHRNAFVRVFCDTFLFMLMLTGLL